ncbi:MAG: hypothetical protein QG675_475 [Patescibacteria group bacterium]|jgi:hypothetical protein|nr:hypothetical protein [Patescibacteria group bacterium]
MAKNNNLSNMVGWSVFAGVLMVLAGMFQAIVGLMAIARDTVYFVGPYTIASLDITQWGWVHLIVAVLVMLAGFSVLKGHMYGRIVGVLLAMVSAVVNMLFLPAYPVWSLLVIVIDVVIIYSLIVYGGELKEA